MVTSRYQSEPNSKDTEARALCATTNRAKYSQTSKNRTPNAAPVQLHRNVAAKRMYSFRVPCSEKNHAFLLRNLTKKLERYSTGKLRHTFWIGSTLSCWRTCSKCSTHTVDYPHHSTFVAAKRHGRTAGFLVLIRHRHCRIQSHTARNDVGPGIFRARWSLRIMVKRCYPEFLGMSSKCCLFWRCHCSERERERKQWFQFM